MQFSALFLATLALVSAAPISPETLKTQEQTQQAMSGVEGSMTNYKQVQDTLNHQLQSHNGHAAQAVINAYITGADSQIDNAIATVSDALAPFTLGVSKAIGNFLLGPFVQSVTNGAEVLISNLLGGGIDLMDAEMTAQLTGNYARLASFASKNNVDASKLQSLSSQISQTVSGKSKRENGLVEGIKGAITNLKQTVDTLTEQLKTGDGHAGKDVVNAAITGLDSQIDNAAAVISKGLNGVTLGISGEIGDFLLGPFFQSVTNGAEVIISNVIGGSVDIVTDGTAKLFSTALSKLHAVGNDLSISKDNLESLAKVQKQVAHLKAPKKDGKKDGDKKTEKRATDSDLSGVKGSMTNYKQVQDTLNHQLQSHNGHAAQAVINAYITGADSQIDNAIATVSDALAPFTLGLSKAVGDVLLGPFVQAVTNGAEVVISNVIGGSIDAVSDISLEAYAKTLDNLSQAATKFGVRDEYTKSLAAAQQKVAQMLPKSH